MVIHAYMVQRHWMRIGYPIRFTDGEKVIAVLATESTEVPDEMHVTFLVEMPPMTENFRHYIVKITNMPPTEIVCSCGETFTGSDPVEEVKAHVDENAKPDNPA